MPERENKCEGCENNCCERFKLYRSGAAIAELLEKYPFFRVVETGVELIGNREVAFTILDCDRLLLDGSCEGYPENRAPFCENTGVKTRPAVKCKLNDYVINKK